MGEIRTFRDDDVLKPLLDAIPKRKMGRVVRRALYNYFFKGKDKVMMEDEEVYIEKEIKIDNSEDFVDLNRDNVTEIKFDMFE